MISSELKSTIIIDIISQIEICIISQLSHQYYIQLNSFKYKMDVKKETKLLEKIP